MAKFGLSESQIQEQLVNLLHLYASPDVCWWACPNGDFRHPRVGARLKRQGVRPGASDLMFVVEHMFHGLELKSDTGSQTDTQREFARSLEKAGGVYHIAYGLNEAFDVLRDIGVFRPDFVPAIAAMQLRKMRINQGALNAIDIKRSPRRSRNNATTKLNLRAARYR